jgi:hypothetical protein
MSEEYILTDWIKSVTHNKTDLIGNSEYPEMVEKQYLPFIMNKILGRFADTILHANEMNMNHHLSNDAQYRYYLNVLRPKNRYKKKHDKDKKLEDNLALVQRYYVCNKTVARQYLNVIGKEGLEHIKEKMNVGGDK